MNKENVMQELQSVEQKVEQWVVKRMFIGQCSDDIGPFSSYKEANAFVQEEIRVLRCFYRSMNSGLGGFTSESHPSMYGRYLWDIIVVLPGFASKTKLVCMFRVEELNP